MRFRSLRCHLYWPLPRVTSAMRGADEHAAGQFPSRPEYSKMLRETRPLRMAANASINAPTRQNRDTIHPPAIGAFMSRNDAADKALVRIALEHAGLRVEDVPESTTKRCDL